jgi:hypothetical protein
MKGYNRLFLALTLLWAAFWTVLYPLNRQWVGQQEAITDHNKEDKNCDALVVELPEWNMTKNCYQRSSENFKNALGFYSFKNFWAYPVIFWRLFLPLIVVPPVIVYGLAALGVWVRNGFKTKPSHS